MKAITAAVLVLLTLAACGRSNPEASSLDASASAPSDTQAYVPTGTLKLRTIYDWMPEGSRVGDHTYPDGAALNGRWDYPEPIYGGWPVTITPIDASGAETGPARAISTLQELHEGGGRHLQLPAGHYRVTLAQPAITAGGTWSITGVQVTEWVSTTARPASSSADVEVFPYTQGGFFATTVRFLQVCRLNSEVVPFPASFGGDTTQMQWPCRPTFAVAPEPTPATHLDATFGIGGISELDLPPNSEQLNAAAVLPDGRILVAGSAASGPLTTDPQDFLVARLNPDGQLDASFGQAGSATTDFGTFEQASELHLLPDGRFYAAGPRYTPPVEYTNVGELAIARYQADGSLDTTFGQGGKVIVTSPAYPARYGWYERSTALAVLHDGRVFIAGFDEQTHAFSATRLLANGQLDETFASGGLAVLDPIPPEQGCSTSVRSVSITLDASGRALLAGTVIRCTGHGMLWYVARLTAEGIADPSFGENGRFLTPPQLLWQNNYLTSLIAQPDGRILLAGVGTPNGQIPDARDDWHMVRLLSNGQLDPSFGQGGAVRQDIAFGQDWLPVVLLLPDGRIIAAGAVQASAYSPDPFTLEVAVARFLPNGNLDPSFGEGGRVITVVPGHQTIRGMALEPDGRLIVVGGTSDTDFPASPMRALLLRYTP